MRIGPWLIVRNDDVEAAWTKQKEGHEWMMARQKDLNRFTESIRDAHYARVLDLTIENNKLRKLINDLRSSDS